MVAKSITYGATNEIIIGSLVGIVHGNTCVPMLVGRLLVWFQSPDVPYHIE